MHFKLDIYSILEFEYFEFKPIIFTLFQENDKILKVSDTDEIDSLQYAQKNGVVKQRLEIMGFTLAKSKELLAEAIDGGISHTKSFLQDINSDPWRKDLNKLENMSFDKWLEFVRNIKETGEATECTPRFMVNDENGYFGLPLIQEEEYEPRYFIRAFLELCPDDSIVSLDFDGLYFPEDEVEVCNVFKDSMRNTYAAHEKIIVLTEGSTDKEFLDGSMKLLYPEYYDYYSFMEFPEINRHDGGASWLTKYLKAFINTGIKNRIIAVFDNDTEGQQEISLLKQGHLPNNISVISYPDNDLAKNYPTHGPTGKINMNINALACSIELYLGEDTLRDKSNNLFPVQWKGFNKKMKRYQGEIMNKKEIHKKFRLKLSKCEEASNIDDFDWVGLKRIFNTIFNAFE